MTRILVVFLTSASLLPARVADAAMFNGHTGRSGAVQMITAGTQVVSVTVDWRLRCPDGERIKGSLELRPEPATAGPRAFSAVGIGGVAGSIGSADAAISGVRRGSGATGSWSGVFTVHADVPVDGTDSSQRCTGPRLRWRAWRESFGSGRWAITSEAGDWAGVGPGRPAESSKGHDVTAWGDRHLVTFVASPWWARFSAPKGGQLKAGTRYAPVQAVDARGPAAGLSVFAGHACGTVTGTFTVTRARYNARGRMTDYAVSFEQHCEAMAPALRGSLSFRSYR